MKYNTHSFHSTCSPSCRDSPADAVKSGTKHGQPITSPRGLFSRHRGRGPLRGVARRRFIRTATGFLPLSRASHPPQRPRPCSPRRLPPRVRKGLVSVTTGHARGESVRRCHVCARSVHCRSAINGSSQPARTRATPHLSITITHRRPRWGITTTTTTTSNRPHSNELPACATPRDFRQR